MEEELGLENILSAEETENLFADVIEEETPHVEEGGEKENKETKETTTEVDPESLFEEKPESVGSEEEIIEEQEDTTPKGSGASPKNFYSSIANALKEEGIFPDLDDDVVTKAKTPEDFRDLVEQQIKAGLEERQRKIDEALNAGVEPSEINKYESTINYLNSLQDSDLNDESDKGETLRKQLIYQDFINRGYSKERANREVQKSLNAGTDIDDAKEALKSNVDFFNGQYEDLVKSAREEAEQEKKERQEEAEKLKTSILSDKETFTDLSLDKNTRQRIYDNISKPVYKDPETGEFYTAIQKYERDNRLEFLKNVSLVFTLTDGFKNLDGLVKGKVKKEIKKGLRELENTLNNTSRTSDGSLKYATGFNDDPESLFGKGVTIDI